MRVSRAGMLAATALGGVLYEYAPTTTAIASMRRHLLPDLAGAGRPDHVALTFDDGPHRASTPRFLEVLAKERVQATFFVLGATLDQNRYLVHRILGEGHEVALHGWAHHPHVLWRPGTVEWDVRRGYRAVVAASGVAPAFWRPPHGIPTTRGLQTARSLGMRPVLWTADGRDWRAEATPASVTRRVQTHLQGGGVVLLHDSGSVGADAWPSGLAALPPIIETCKERGWQVGPLRDHWSGREG